jgi:hypothetical protein
MTTAPLEADPGDIGAEPAEDPGTAFDPDQQEPDASPDPGVTPDPDDLPAEES